jgi:hypothetical protein
MNNLSCFIHFNNHQFLPTSTENKKAFAPVVVINKYGGAERDRTDDLLLARQALSQLSYSPIF